MTDRFTGAERMRQWRDRNKPNRGPWPKISERVLVECWCHKHTDIVDAEMIRRCQTWSCNNPDCHPPKGNR